MTLTHDNDSHEVATLFHDTTTKQTTMFDCKQQCLIAIKQKSQVIQQ